jgi:ribosomal protein S18 acetylase RimI-like enzyme
MSPNALVRRATVDDIPAVLDVARRTWRATYAGKIPDDDVERFVDAAYSAEQLGGAVQRLGDGFAVAVVSSDIVGYLLAGTNRDGNGELFAIYVLPEWQGLGAGQLLWDTACSVLRAGGHARMHLWVLASNESARRFYERQGATAFAEREFPVGDGVIAEAGYAIALV